MHGEDPPGKPRSASEPLPRGGGAATRPGNCGAWCRVLLQLLCLITPCHFPATFLTDSIRDEIKILRPRAGVPQTQLFRAWCVVISPFRRRRRRVRAAWRNMQSRQRRKGCRRPARWTSTTGWSVPFYPCAPTKHAAEAVTRSSSHFPKPPHYIAPLQEAAFAHARRQPADPSAYDRTVSLSDDQDRTEQGALLGAVVFFFRTGAGARVHRASAAQGHQGNQYLFVHRDGGVRP